MKSRILLSIAWLVAASTAVAAEQSNPLCALYSQRVAEVMYSPSSLWQRAHKPLSGIRFAEDLEASDQHCSPESQSSALFCAELDRLLSYHRRFLRDQWAIEESSGQPLSLLRLMTQKSVRSCTGPRSINHSLVAFGYPLLSPADRLVHKAPAHGLSDRQAQSKPDRSIDYSPPEYDSSLLTRWHYVSGVNLLYFPAPQ
ncbi:hypothetical protein MIB92_13630 [Aestuariirhabdus sp. Z084]|uniref:hypothetical protein n=1 Tax=Aestuariirhabdus haliotis TaxID=2918751 RepID=UPI00201B3858|nr:hypothetical protein [Aestuariirhabdus haliotis]MCL6416696.1 hypothetical protein [Aestuariirhabdus haliotis]MCL6420715.1 hypothetical protein [Aestuariirhabdus haliotis]